MKRIVSLAILLSMTLHCASRLGILSYLYQNRHDIAFSIGLIEEVPIAMCASDYFSTQSLPIVKHAHDTDRQMPVPFPYASEIHLFVEAPYDLALEGHHIRKQDHNTPFTDTVYSPHLLAIFHPPC